MADLKPGKVKLYQVDSGKHISVDRIIKTDAEWKKILTPEQYEVMRGHGTERPFCQLPINKGHNKGVYECAACGTDLFRFDHKFESGTGWPSFFEPVDPANVDERVDNSFGMERMEVCCARCGAHLGHIFDDGPPPTGKRFCINQVALEFVPDKENEPLEDFQIGDHVKVFFDSKLGNTEGWFEGTVLKIDAYSKHRSFYWVQLNTEAQEILGVKMISVLNPKNIQRFN